MNFNPDKQFKQDYQENSNELDNLKKGIDTLSISELKHLQSYITNKLEEKDIDSHESIPSEYNEALQILNKWADNPDTYQEVSGVLGKTIKIISDIIKDSENVSQGEIGSFVENRILPIIRMSTSQLKYKLDGEKLAEVFGISFIDTKVGDGMDNDLHEITYEGIDPDKKRTILRVERKGLKYKNIIILWLIY